MNEVIANKAIVRVVTTDQSCERKQKFTEAVEVINLSEPEKTLLPNLLRDYHDIFTLDETDRGETD